MSDYPMAHMGSCGAKYECSQNIVTQILSADKVMEGFAGLVLLVCFTKTCSWGVCFRPLAKGHAVVVLRNTFYYRDPPRSL